MPAEVQLSDGTTIKTEQNTNSDQILREISGHTSFKAILDEKGTSTA